MAEAAETPESPDREPPKAVFRVPGTALLAVAVLALCVSPVAWSVPGLQALYLIPIGLAVWIVRTRTTATAEGITVRTVSGRRELPWSDMKGLALTERSGVHAVLTDDTTVALPAVRTRHLPVLSLVSGGRLADPSGVTDEQNTED
ncbi:PH domain-containing protein [Amycolatopsis suaedae]|uniref:PH domain-containing protein n=1 Tax=Amycolatopsis suaedae TaxID=2510978 RepID=UPI001F116D62|nr:PH domain-containing protein [Amycolatopsis suaedae]